MSTVYFPKCLNNKCKRTRFIKKNGYCTPCYNKQQIIEQNQLILKLQEELQLSRFEKNIVEMRLQKSENGCDSLRKRNTIQKKELDIQKKELEIQQNITKRLQTRLAKLECFELLFDRSEQLDYSRCLKKLKKVPESDDQLVIVLIDDVEETSKIDQSIQINQAVQPDQAVHSDQPVQNDQPVQSDNITQFLKSVKLLNDNGLFQFNAK